MTAVGDAQATPLYFSRDTDHLGFLEKQLKDLAGFATLTHELLQNADDARATRIEFRVDVDALRVINDGVFSDCQRQEHSDCPWLTDEVPGRRCDFHRLRHVASGDKRRELETTGAFGVGFISVYQVTDRPEIVSAGRHWVIDEVQEASQRIRQCPGCPTCQGGDVPPTLFVLPWARDEASPFRIRTRSTPLAVGDEHRLRDEVKAALPTALLFLRHVQEAELWVDGTQQARVERLMSGDSALVDDGSGATIWHLLHGSFQARAQELRALFSTGIEHKRKAEVTLAIPATRGVQGVLCAYLPTQHRTGLPFHLNADFIPTSDRKRVQFEGDAARAWNEAALEAAADALARGLPILQRELSPAALWALLNDAFLARPGAGRADEARFGVFWQRVEPVVRESATVYTGDQRWVHPRAAVHFTAALDSSMVSDIERLGIAMVHPELQPFYNALSAVGVQPLSRGRYIGALLADWQGSAGQQGSDGVAPESSSDAGRRDDDVVRRWWQEPDVLARVWATLAVLPEGSEKSQKDDRAAIRALPLVLCRSGSVEAPQDCWLADEVLAALMERVIPGLPFAAPDLPYHALLEGYGDRLTPSELVGQLEHDAGELPDTYERDPEAIRDLLQWLAGHRSELTAGNLAARLRRLPLVPSAGALRPLDALSLPGDFTDELGIAGIVDLDAAGAVRDFLQDLGARPLTVAEYTREHVPEAFRRGDVGESTRRAVVHLLAARLGELRDVNGIQAALAATPLVECEDGVWRVPSAAYFRTASVLAAFGEETAMALLPEPAAGSVREFLHWAGVREEPRAEDIVEAVLACARQAPSDDARKRNVELAKALTASFEAGELSADLITRLKATPWFPGRRERSRWYRPAEVYAVFQDYLFETQAEFLDLPRELQQRATKLLTALGVPTAPSPVLVARHILASSAAGSEVNRQVYEVLAREVIEGRGVEVVRVLRDHPVLQVTPGHFLRARECVWGEHALGARRATLDATWRPYQPLLEALGVRESVDAADALDVLRAYAEEFGTTNRVLPAVDRQIVTNAWAMVSGALEAGTIQEAAVRALRGLKVVVSPAGHLMEPSALLFADRTDLATRFERFRQFFIVRDAATWRALLIAGVRPLWKAVHTKLVLHGEQTDDAQLRERLRERYPALLQVATATLPPSRVAESLSRLLTNLRCLRAGAVELRLALELGGRRFEGPPLDMLAAWQQDSRTVAWTGSQTSRSWAALARALSLALDPDGEWTGPLASGMKEALSAQSLEDAHDALEALGYPRLSQELPEWEPSRAHRAEGADGQNGAGERGATAPEEVPGSARRTDGEVQDADGTTKERARSDGRSRSERAERPRDRVAGANRVNPGPDTSTVQAGDTAETARAGAEEANPELEPLGDEAAPTVDTGAPGAAVAHRSNVEGGEPADQRHQSADGSARVEMRQPPRPQRRYAATVYAEPTLAAPGASAEDGRNPWSARLETDAAGIQLVLEHEVRAGRNPQPMTHANPGYDVESRGRDGQVLRYIEVKSTSEPWGIRGVALSPVQLEHAKEKRERYWLYVVEQAGRPEARVLRLHDPYGHVEQFAFDGTWRPFSEEGDEDDGSEH